MKTSLIIILISTVLISCSVKPEPLHYGQDGCYTCKMTLMDKKFGAEIVTKKGKIYKFDDMNCMINFYNSSVEPAENIAYRLVIDFANPENFIDAQEAFYIKSENIKSPMASQVAAFSTKEQRDKYNKELNGAILTWGELVTQFK
jgi:copper chaperone NosL